MNSVQKKMNTFQSENHKTSLFKELVLQIKDNRRINKGNIRHSVAELLFLTLAAVVSGCNTWESVETFGKAKLEWFRKYFPYKYKTPSDATLGSFFGALDHENFVGFFIEFTKILSQQSSRHVAIDGKTICGIASQFGTSPLHIVSAFCHQNRLTLCQEVVADKSNELDAIPKLLDLLELKGCIVSIDAMGCQRDIAEKIIEKQADYILQVKDNQKGLKEQIIKLFAHQKPNNETITIDSGHGRMEKRTCRVMDNLLFLDDKDNWAGLQTIVEIHSEIYQKKTQVKSECVRYYISSLKADSKTLIKDIRNHWAIENNLHWNLDVIFKEDNALKRKGNSAANFNIISKMALSMLEAEKSTKQSKPTKRLKASLDDSYRELILNI
jgi:predicted transposase YbfD/YdcC